MSSPTIEVPSSPPRDLSWQAQAACRRADPELFAPVSGTEPKPPGWAFEANDRYCSRCPVVDACRAYADSLGIEALGVWGGQWRHTPKCDLWRLTVTDIPLNAIRPRVPGELSEMQRKVLDAVGAEPMRQQDIAVATGLQRRQVEKVLRVLGTRGLLVKAPNSAWTRPGKAVA